MADRIILHSDLNNFYASVEQLYRPELRGHPIAVTGDPELRHGVVLAKSAEAKRFGVQTGDTIGDAMRKCPKIQFLPSNFELYREYSRLAREIYTDYTDQVEPYGMDECWLDVTGSVGLFGSGRQIADEIRARIYRELGVTVSIGVSFCKTISKLGSDLQKPDATTEIPRSRMEDIVWKLPAAELIFVGRAYAAAMYKRGIRTIGDLARQDPKKLFRWYGKNGVLLWRLANGDDNAPVLTSDVEYPIKTIGNSTTPPRDLCNDQDVRIVLTALSESVSHRLRELEFNCRTVQVWIRSGDLSSYVRQGPMDYPNRTALAIREKAFELYKRHHSAGVPIRSIGVRAMGLIPQGTEQISFLPEIAELQERERLEAEIDKLRARYGINSIRSGLMHTDNLLSNQEFKQEHGFFVQGA